MDQPLSVSSTGHPAPLPELVLSVGHSTRTLEDFLDLLGAHRVECVADVRSIPRSRRHPHFGIELLPQSLRQAGIDYVHLPGLGGLRKARPDSLNLGWRHENFRGYADYMQTPEFERWLQELLALARRRRVAVMCAEAVPWRCHRSLLADALVARGVCVEHIMSPKVRNVHKLRDFACVEHGQVHYPKPEETGLWHQD